MIFQYCLTGIFWYCNISKLAILQNSILPNWRYCNIVTACLNIRPNLCLSTPMKTKIFGLELMKSFYGVVRFHHSFFSQFWWGPCLIMEYPTLWPAHTWPPSWSRSRFLKKEEDLNKIRNPWLQSKFYHLWLWVLSPTFQLWKNAVSLKGF